MASYLACAQVEPGEPLQTGTTSTPLIRTAAPLSSTNACAAVEWRLPLGAPLGGDGDPKTLLTETCSVADAEELPVLSRATARKECHPFWRIVVSQATEYGSLVSSWPRFCPSTWNCTPAAAAPPSL